MFDPFRRNPFSVCLLIIFVGILLGVLVGVLAALGALEDVADVVPYAYALELAALLILAVGGQVNLPNALSNLCGNVFGGSLCCCAKLTLFYSSLIAILFLAIVAAGVSGFFAVFLAASAVFTSFFSLAVYLYCLICL